jgi:hypothetical protein
MAVQKVDGNFVVKCSGWFQHLKATISVRGFANSTILLCNTYAVMTMRISLVTFSQHDHSENLNHCFSKRLGLSSPQCRPMVLQTQRYFYYVIAMQS